MFPFLAVSLLVNANLSPDWMTLYIANRGIEFRIIDVAELPFEEVQRFALDQLAVVAGTSEEWDVYRITDAESLRHGAAVRDIFRNLAQCTGTSENQALRKWRYAVLCDALPQIEAETIHAITLQNEDHDGWIYRAYDLITNWGTVSSENPPPDVSLSWNEKSIRASFSAINAWLSAEYAAILANR